MMPDEPEKLDRTRETPLRLLERPTDAARRQAYLVHIYPSGPNMGRRYLLTDAPIVIGRGSDCPIQIDDHSVSRRHARVQFGAEGHEAIDLESTNGTFVNDLAVRRQQLRDGDYLRVGNCIYRYLAGGNVEAEYHEEIYRLAIVDALTEIPNKRYLLEFLGRELARSVRYQRPLTVILFDLDRFKTINDERGHLCGDYVLRELAACLRPAIRAEELFARYGGEEFVVVLPECTTERAVSVGERLRAVVAQHPFHFNEQPVLVTISAGLATTTGRDDDSVAGLLHRADEKLYEAKRDGRNRVVA
jgi:diguanylate cyclase (GGDEF)-like protein